MEALVQTWPWYVAGPLIGLLVPLLLLFGGKQFGISANLRHMCAAALPTRAEFFRYDWKKTGLWNLVFILGIALGGFLAVQLLGHPDPAADLSAETLAALRELGVSDFRGLVPSDLISWQGLASLPGLLREGDRLNVGASFTLPATLEGDVVRTLGEGLARDTLRVDGRVSTDGSVRIPLSASLGASYELDERWTFAASGLYEPWSAYESDFPAIGRFAYGSALHDRLRLSGGLEVVPAGDDRMASYLARTAYRLGASLDRAYALPGEGAETVEFEHAIDAALLEYSDALSNRYPLSVCPVLAYILAKEREVDNIRAIARGKEAGLSSEEIESELVIR